jgi:hypothetical protein
MIISPHLLIFAHECDWCQHLILKETLRFIHALLCVFKVRDFTVLRMGIHSR